jgi:hypothetical protein
MKTFLYKRNGSGDIFRKSGKKVECFYRGKWCKTIFADSWDGNVLLDITEQEARKLIKELSLKFKGK